MNRVDFWKIAASSLILGSSVTTLSPAVLARESVQPGKSAKIAAAAARNANKAFAKKRYDKAVVFAEAAVAAMPGSAEYRALLGQSYLLAGRFQSAEMALTDAVALDPADARAQLNLALSQISLAKTDKALATLDAAKPVLSPADFGLARALAGDAEGAITILEAAARGIDADAKTRQNLGLAYALANRWAQARAMAAQDLAAPQVDQRMTEWALFAHQTASWDQIASLLGIKPAYDGGMPTQLALNRSIPPSTTTTVAVAMSVPEPQPAAVVPEPVADEPEPAVATPVAEEATAASEPVFETPRPSFATPALLEAMKAEAEPQSAPEAVAVASGPSPIKQAVVPAFAPNRGKTVRVASHKEAVETGRFVVQLGAFSTETRANIAWKQAYGRTRELGDHNVGTPRVQVRGASLYRLSVSGFTTQAEANQVCRRVKSAGGQCFVRSIVNGSPMQWAKRRGNTQLASSR